MLSLSEQKNCLKRHLELVKINQELTEELDFKNYRIYKLEQEIRDLKKSLSQKDKESNIIKRDIKISYERINIYG